MTPSPASAKAPPPRLTLRARIDAYERLLRLDKPIGTLLLLWPTLSALWLASFGYAPFALVVVFTMGTLLMRSAGCAFNDWADRDVDAHVKRTADRPLAAGVIAPWEALAVAAALSLIAFVLVLSTNRATVLWSIPALAIAIAYPFFKRFFALPQALLGVAFSFGIPMAYAAVYKGVPLIAWLLLVVNGFWVMAYDTEYAMVDRDDDLRIGIRTSAIAFGRWDVAVIATAPRATRSTSQAWPASATGCSLGRSISRAWSWRAASLRITFGSSATARAKRAFVRSCTTTGSA